MSFNIFGPATTDSIRVGYISTDRGFVEGVSVCEANDYAKLNPGTQFVFKNRKYIKFLNINEVNKLTPNDLLAGINTCEGIQLTSECPPPEAYFYGGGGVGVQGNPVFGFDGALLAVDLVSGGFGYQYPPIVEVKDGCGIGAGAVIRAVLGEVVETVEVYDQEEDFEEYEICEPTDVGYGNRYGPDGELLGEWDPTTYTNLTKDPIRREIQEYQDFLQKKTNPWWSTRKAYAPLKLTSSTKTTRTKFDVTDASYLEKQRADGAVNPVAWNEFMNAHAISPVPPSNVKGSDFAGIPFTFEWEEDFPYDGEYIFRGLCDNKVEFYLDNLKVSNLGGFNQGVTPIYKTLKAGVHRIRLDLLNIPIYETKAVQPQIEEQKVGSIFIREGDQYYILIGGNDVVEIDFVFDWNDDENFGYAATKIMIPSESNGPVVLSRPLSGTIGSAKATGTFKAGKKYGPIIFEGASSRFKDTVIVDTGPLPEQRQQRIGLYDNNPDDPITNASLTATNARQLSPPRVIIPPKSNPVQNKVVFNTIDYIDKADRRLWRTNVYNRGGFINEYGVCPFDTTSQLEDNPYAGTHRIVWNNINFPVDGNYIIEIEVDDNVNLTFTGSGTETVINKKGFSGVDQGTGKSIETKYFKAGNYTITADLEQIPGGKFGFSGIKGTNPMALAINVQTSFAETQVISAKSWNENPMGVAFTIDAPQPPIPQEPIPLQEGRCPNNPIWTTRFPGAKERWYPVILDSRWSKFMNRYAISPVPPLSENNSEASGVVWRNSWDLDIPYDGFYALRGTKDNAGRILIDGNEISKLNHFKNQNPDSTKFFLSKGRHEIQVEVENFRQEIFELIDKKVFSTRDWEVAPIITQQQEQKAGSIFIREGDQYYILIGGNDIVEIDFVFTWEDDENFGYAATKITIPTESNGPVVLSRPLSGTVGSVNATGTFKANKKYGPIIFEGTSSRFKDTVIRNTGPNPENYQQEIGLWDDNPDDDITNASLIAINARQISPPRVTQTLVPISEKNGVTYSGPELASYRSGFISPAYFDETGQEVMGKTFIMRWSNVDFFDDGQYTLYAEADDVLIVRIDGVEVGRAKVFEGQRVTNFNITKGKRTVELELTNIPGNPQSTFETNPVVAAAIITKKVSVGTGITRPWTTNPIGISAILIPPPCPKRVKGKGVVVDVIVDDPGNGYPVLPGDSYPAALRLKAVEVEDTGINYNCGVDQIQITPSNGAVLDYVCDSFGRIIEVKVLNPGLGFTTYPEITIPTETGINATFRPQFEVVRDPIVLPEKLIQVTDLVGLKQTGYVDGRAYYGSVFYKEGVRYAGFYETAGDLVQVYDTLQESITARVTTPASAILRQGTDVTSNDPRLNIPGTPENLI
jgi:hypothetical protein